MKFLAVPLLILAPLTALRSGDDAKPQPAVSETVAAETRDVVTAGEDARIDSPVSADVVVAGKKIVIAHPVGGYVIAAGEQIIVDAAVGNDVFAAAANVRLRAEVGDNVWAAGQTVTLTESGRIRGDAHLAGNLVQVHGRLDRQLRIAAASALIDAEIGGDVEVSAVEFELSRNALVHGDLIVTSPTPPVVPQGAVVEGSVIHLLDEDQQDSMIGQWITSWVMTFLVAMLVGGFVLILFPRWVDDIVGQISNRPGRSLLVGIIGFVVLPVLCVVFAVTIIGIPLALMLGSMLVATFVLSIALASVWLGRLSLICCGRPESGPWPRLFVGALLLSLLASAPYAGLVVRGAVLSVGLGAVLLVIARCRRDRIRPSMAG